MEAHMPSELEIKRKIDDVEIVVKLTPQGPLTSVMQEKIESFRFEVIRALDVLAA
jgi:hypothetical protein